MSSIIFTLSVSALQSQVTYGEKTLFWLFVTYSAISFGFRTWASSEKLIRSLKILPAIHTIKCVNNWQESPALRHWDSFRKRMSTAVSKLWSYKKEASGHRCLGLPRQRWTRKRWMNVFNLSRKCCQGATSRWYQKFKFRCLKTVSKGEDTGCKYIYNLFASFHGISLRLWCCRFVDRNIKKLIKWECTDY